MDLEDAAALSVCARCEKQRLEGQHERIRVVASGRWCLAMRSSQQERCDGSKHVHKEGARARAGGLCVRLIAARVSSITRHRATGFRAMQAEAKAARAGEAFFCVSRVCCCCCACGKTVGPSSFAVSRLVFTLKV